ncbi:reverse transcriptase [Senna tora]|uniref:Reverse transcriptase n=1 Tax=Senna tora TaxID=362788 RepID=A0A834TGK2_9FABA|nr:reverse transcriptase [Senna tora]
MGNTLSGFILELVCDRGIPFHPTYLSYELMPSQFNFLMSSRIELFKALRIRDIFYHFGLASSLHMNPAKTEVKFNPNTSQPIRQNCVNILHCAEMTRLCPYLRSYIDGARKDRENYQKIYRHLAKRLQGWKTHLLSQAVRYTLIHYVLEIIPIYYLQFTKLTKVEARNCDRLLANFFWGHGDNQKESMELVVFLDASRVVLMHLHCGRKSIIAPTWCRSISSGWLDVTKLIQVYLPQKAKDIPKYPISFSNQSDRLVWKLSTNRKYSVKEAYTFLTNPKDNTTVILPLWRRLWSSMVPFLYLVFFWRLVNKDCPFARAIWFGSNLAMTTDRWGNNLIIHNLSSWNKVLFNNGKADIVETMHLLRHVIEKIRSNMHVDDMCLKTPRRPCSQRVNTRCSLADWPVDQVLDLHIHWKGIKREKHRGLSMWRKQGTTLHLLFVLVVNSDMSLVESILRLIRQVLEGIMNQRSMRICLYVDQPMVSCLRRHISLSPSGSIVREDVYYFLSLFTHFHVCSGGSNLGGLTIAPIK